MTRCKANNKDGTKCKVNASIDGYCLNHYHYVKKKIERRNRKK